MRERHGACPLSEVKDFTEPALEGREGFCRCFVSFLRFAPDSTQHDRFYLRLQLGIRGNGRITFTVWFADVHLKCFRGILIMGVKGGRVCPLKAWHTTQGGQVRVRSRLGFMWKLISDQRILKLLISIFTKYIHTDLWSRCIELNIWFVTWIAP